MNYSTDHTIKLQDGSLFNFKKRFKKHSQTLVQVFAKVKDGRSKFGKRHSLALMLTILFSGIIAGNTTVKDCHLWARHHKKWLTKYFDLSHSIPDERTISRCIAKVDVDSLVRAYLLWRETLYGLDTSDTASFDGKSLRAIKSKQAVKHILSLFSHSTHQILGQIGVFQKENEIPAFRRLLKTKLPQIYGLLLVGDALHTQKETACLIVSLPAHYLLFVKGNQAELEKELKVFFTKIPFQSEAKETNYYDYQRGREIKATITVSTDRQMNEFLGEVYGFLKVNTVGQVKREGVRKTETGQEVKVSETIYFLSSKELSAKEAAKAIRGHWCIENNLHWQKDYSFLEDRCTLRSGNAPQVMTFLRSCCLSLFNLFQFASPTETISNFEKNSSLHHSFLRMSGVI